jgi:Tfp pilus assembly protein PilF
MRVEDSLAQGWELHQRGDHAQAERLYQLALAANPYEADAWCYLGILRHDQKRFDEATSAYERAIALRPDFAVAYNNLGNTLAALERREEAIACFDRAIAIRPGYANALRNRGASLSWLGRLDEAIDCFRQAISLAPNDAQAHTFLGVAYLLQGRYAQGWPEYQWRSKSHATAAHRFRQPEWKGESLDGKTILLIAEQGLGDTIHFVRYARRLRERFACRVVLACQKSLIPLLSSAPGLDAVIPQGAELNVYDVYAPLLNVPGIMGDTLETIPAEVPYLHADRERVDRWKHELQRHQEMRIGIVWQGNPSHEADRMRSAPLASFAPLWSLRGVKFLSLQKGAGETQLASVSPSLPVIPLGARLDNEGFAFLDTAAVLSALDLVITVDTSICHLAGALGVSTWLALAHVPDWRWGLIGESTPWYPTMRLFRQTRRGDWSSVFNAMTRELANRHGGPRSKSNVAPDHGKFPNRIQTRVMVEISPGELIDKITILEIKAERIRDEAKLENVRHELETLTQVRERSVPASPELESMTAQLKAINETLWKVEDAIRECERSANFGAEFIELARSVYRANDHRAKLKREINLVLGSAIVEEKSYAAY